MSSHPDNRDVPIEDPKAKERELRERIAKAEALKEKALPPETEIEKLERRAVEAELEARNALAIADARAKYGPAGVGHAQIPTRLGVVILKRCDTILWKRFQDLEDPKLEDIEQLVRPSVVYPDRPTFDQWIEELPGALQEITLNLAGLMGVRMKANRGK
jgi:hypothetical protein